jgi:arylformamidase
MTWTDWRPHGMEAQFNPRVAAGAETEPALAFWADQSAARRSELGGQFDIAYGDHPLMRFDHHPGRADLPVIINIHGGYWRALDKSSMFHHVADLAKGGFGAVNMNYPLCPEVTLDEIIGHLIQGLDAVLHRIGNARQPEILMGHSAGAHMALHLTHHPALRDRLVGVAALSGIYEPELVLHLAVNADIRLDAETAARWNCLSHMPAAGPEYYVAVGGGEPSGWIDQSWIMADALRRRGDAVRFHGCSRLNHFNMVDCLCDASHIDGAQLHRWMAGLVR